MPVPPTPKKVSEGIDRILDQLNTEWDLQLPRLHGSKADIAENTPALARRCAARIRYLCFRLPLTSLQSILEDFNEKAMVTRSSWISKPRQERGTLPSLPVTKSNLKRDVIRSRNLGLTRLDEKQRQHLLSLLDTALEDDYKLSLDNESFSRTPAPVPQNYQDRSVDVVGGEVVSRRRSGRISQPALPRNGRDERSPLPARSELHFPDIQSTTTTTSVLDSRFHFSATEGSVPLQAENQRPMPTKRKPEVGLLDEDARRSNKVARPSRQSYLKGFLVPQMPPPPLPVPQPSFNLTTSPPALESFESVNSSAPSEIFDQDERAFSSANTSILESENDESQDYFPTQEATDMLQDEEIARSLDAIDSASLEVQKTFRERLDHVLKFQSHRLPSSLQFEILYEIQSLALSWRLDELVVFKNLERECGEHLEDPSVRWQAVKTMARSKGLHYLQNLTAWAPNAGQLPEHSQSKSTYLSATLHWAAAGEDKLFRLQLNGPVIDKSCRFHRVYGGKRFLTLNVPHTTQKSKIPAYLQPRPDDHAKIHTAVIDWLSTGQLSLAGRLWRPFWVEPTEYKDERYNKVYLFAVSGKGLDARNPNHHLRPLSIEDFIEWHTPIQENLKSSDVKLFARYKLGLSKTVPTVILEQDEIIAVADMRGDGGEHVMNDGCSLMSKGLADEISKMLGLRESPSAFQCRLGGCKGLWIVDSKFSRQYKTRRGFWIEVSESQLKIHPHPAQRDSCEALRTVEVLKTSRPPLPASLNPQLITVLADRGVPRSVLEAKLQAFTQNYLEKLQQSLGDSVLLRGWMQTFHGTLRFGETLFEGALPADRNDKVNMLLDAGFEPTTCLHLHDLFRDRINDYMNWYVEKCRVTLPLSTYVFCCPDPYGVLEEGTVHLGFSHPWEDQTEGQSPWFLSNCQGIVARNPANLPSDAQKISFVQHPMLDTFKDVIIFSTKGRRPLASLLSGGDYDGDEAFVCWDPDIVDRFTNYKQGPPDHISYADCGLHLRSRSLDKVFPDGKLTSTRVADFLAGCLDFNMKPSLLGVCTNEHQKWVYKKSLDGFDALQDTGAIRLAALAGYLVDAPKQGYELPESSWIRVRNEARGTKDLEVPAFKRPEAEVGDHYNKANVIDFLRFLVARPEKEKILIRWNDSKPQFEPRDTVLAHQFVSFQQLAQHYNQTGDDTLHMVLTQLRADIDLVLRDWVIGAAQSKKDQAYRQKLAHCYEKFLEIRPPPDLPQPHLSLISTGRGVWEDLRASCFYVHHYNRGTSILFLLAGDRLCAMKAESLGRSMIMTSQMWSATKMDTKAVRRLQEDLDGNGRLYDMTPEVSMDGGGF